MTVSDPAGWDRETQKIERMNTSVKLNINIDAVFLVIFSKEVNDQDYPVTQVKMSSFICGVVHGSVFS